MVPAKAIPAIVMYEDKKITNSALYYHYDDYLKKTERASSYFLVTSFDYFSVQETDQTNGMDEVTVSHRLQKLLKILDGKKMEDKSFTADQKQYAYICVTPWKIFNLTQFGFYVKFAQYPQTADILHI